MYQNHVQLYVRVCFKYVYMCDVYICCLFICMYMFDLIMLFIHLYALMLMKLGFCVFDFQQIVLFNLDARL